MAGNKRKRAHIFVSGRVQGVLFRDSARRRARQLGLTGWVRNLSDGRVEAVFEGEEPAVEEMISWAKHGPAFAKVEDLKVAFEEYCGKLGDFEIKD